MREFERHKGLKRLYHYNLEWWHSFNIYGKIFHMLFMFWIINIVLLPLVFGSWFMSKLFVNGEAMRLV